MDIFRGRYSASHSFYPDAWPSQDCLRGSHKHLNTFPAVSTLIYPSLLCSILEFRIYFFPWGGGCYQPRYIISFWYNFFQNPIPPQNLERELKYFFWKLVFTILLTGNLKFVVFFVLLFCIK